MRLDFSKVERLIKQGKHVIIIRRGLPVFEIRPVEKKTQERHKINFSEMIEELWGEKMLSEEDVKETWQHLRNERLS